ncbi:inovirus-type Gp2 protein [Escherichia coli]|uniref:YagK/YfjJ domain-containing protein n=1 Tax=Enterobacteriaceae TaxID=543 RepID=UPI00345BFD9F
MSNTYTTSFTEDWFLSSLLNQHINEMVERYSCLLALRMDFFYQRNTEGFMQLDHHKLEHDIRTLIKATEGIEASTGYFWVIEWTERHGYHAHAVFWLDRQKTQTTYPFSEWISKRWRAITHQDGGSYRCEYREHYQGNINTPVRYDDADSILNIRRVLSYLAKEEQKEGLCAYGCNDVPPRPASGRPRKPQ